MVVTSGLTCPDGSVVLTIDQSALQKELAEIQQSNFKVQQAIRRQPGVTSKVSQAIVNELTSWSQRLTSISTALFNQWADAEIGKEEAEKAHENCVELATRSKINEDSQGDEISTLQDEKRRLEDEIKKWEEAAARSSEELASLKKEVSKLLDQVDSITEQFNRTNNEKSHMWQQMMVSKSDDSRLNIGANSRQDLQAIVRHKKSIWMQIGNSTERVAQIEDLISLHARLTDKEEARGAKRTSDDQAKRLRKELLDILLKERAGDANAEDKGVGEKDDNGKNVKGTDLGGKELNNKVAELSLVRHSDSPAIVPSSQLRPTPTPVEGPPPKLFGPGPSTSQSYHTTNTNTGIGQAGYSSFQPAKPQYGAGFGSGSGGSYSSGPMSRASFERPGSTQTFVTDHSNNPNSQLMNPMGFGRGRGYGPNSTRDSHGPGWFGGQRQQALMGTGQRMPPPGLQVPRPISGGHNGFRPPTSQGQNGGGQQLARVSAPYGPPPARPFSQTVPPATLTLRPVSSGPLHVNDRDIAAFRDLYDYLVDTLAGFSQHHASEVHEGYFVRAANSEVVDALLNLYRPLGHQQAYEYLRYDMMDGPIMRRKVCERLLLEFIVTRILIPGAWLTFSKATDDMLETLIAGNLDGKQFPVPVPDRFYFSVLVFQLTTPFPQPMAATAM